MPNANRTNARNSESDWLSKRHKPGIWIHRETSKLKPDASPSPPPFERSGLLLSAMKVTVKRVNAVAVWKWNVPNDDVCGICRVPFDGCCPDCHVPGDDCPILTGQCKHVFHMYCSNAVSSFDFGELWLTFAGTVLKSGCIRRIQRVSVRWTGSPGVRRFGGVCLF